MDVVRFYCGINEVRWNYHPVVPGPYACIAPVYGRTEKTHSVNRISVPKDTLVIQDSGAFSDGPAQRLNFEEALERQIAHAEHYDYTQQITHRASYDLLIDERWKNGERNKLRWDEGDAELAVRISVRAAAFLAQHRQGISLILSAQGVTVKQYLHCIQQLMPYVQEGDIVGLGGWCILGKIPSLLTPFRETLSAVIPFLAKEQIKRVHIWGVCFPKAINDLVWLCQQYGIALSTDSAYPTMAPAFGNWGFGPWRDNTYLRPPVLDTCKLGNHSACVGCRGLERIRHVEATRQWLATFQAEEPSWIQQQEQNNVILEAS